MISNNKPAPAPKCATCGKSELNIVHVGPLESRFHPFNETEGQRVKRLLEERERIPAPAPSGVLSAEGFKDLLSILQISMLCTGKKHIQNREDSRAKLLAHDVSLRAVVLSEKARADKLQEEVDRLRKELGR